MPLELLQGLHKAYPKYLEPHEFSFASGTRFFIEYVAPDPKTGWFNLTIQMMVCGKPSGQISVKLENIQAYWKIYHASDFSSIEELFAKKIKILISLDNVYVKFTTIFDERNIEAVDIRTFDLLPASFETSVSGIMHHVLHARGAGVPRYSK